MFSLSSTPSSLKLPIFPIPVVQSLDSAIEWIKVDKYYQILFSSSVDRAAFR